MTWGDLVYDLLVTHERCGASDKPSENGHLCYPDDINRPLREAAQKRVLKYQNAYANDHNITCMPAIASTTGRLDAEFLRLLFWHAHRERRRRRRRRSSLIIAKNDLERHAHTPSGDAGADLRSQAGGATRTPTPPRRSPPNGVHDTPTQLSSAFTLKPTRPGCTAVDRGGWCCSCAAG